MIEGSMCSMMADATVCCLELGEGTVDSGQEEFVEEIERQPQDMEGNVPSRCLPIGGARPEVLGITYFASADCSGRLQANEPPPLNPKRTGTGDSFAFLGKGKGKQKAITDESPEQKEERERYERTKMAVAEVRKSVGRFFMGPANKYYRKVVEQGGENAEILCAHAERMRAVFNPEEFQALPHCIREFEKQKSRETLAFVAWKDKLKARIEKGELPPTLQIDDLDIMDMFYDVKAHSVRMVTK